jgi:hypothetical protein
MGCAPGPPAGLPADVLVRTQAVGFSQYLPGSGVVMEG